MADIIPKYIEDDMEVLYNLVERIVELSNHVRMDEPLLSIMNDQNTPIIYKSVYIFLKQIEDSESGNEVRISMTSKWMEDDKRIALLVHARKDLEHGIAFAKIYVTDITSAYSRRIIESEKMTDNDLKHKALQMAISHLKWVVRCAGLMINDGKLFDFLNAWAAPTIKEES